jgi:hypothetical protein
MSTKPSIKKHRFNSLPEGGEGRPQEVDYGSSKPSYKFKRISWMDAQKHANEATLKAQPLSHTGRCENRRRAAEEWMDQWRVWAGETLRLKENKTYHTVRGDGTSQVEELIDQAQLSSKSSDMDVSSRRPSIKG